MTDSSTQPANRAEGGQTIPAKVDKSGHPADIDRERVKAQVQGLIASGSTINETAKALEPALAGVLRVTRPDTRGRVCRAIAAALHGANWGKALEESGAAWCQFEALQRCYPAFAALMEVVRPLAESACRARRIKLADRRAFDGVARPVFQGGVHVGDVREYSDRLAELLIVGDDRAKYGREGGRGAGQGGGGAPVAIQINVVTADRSATTATIDASTADVTV